MEHFGDIQNGILCYQCLSVFRISLVAISTQKYRIQVVFLSGKVDFQVMLKAKWVLQHPTLAGSRSW